MTRRGGEDGGNDGSDATGPWRCTTIPASRVWPGTSTLGESWPGIVARDAPRLAAVATPDGVRGLDPLRVRAAVQDLTDPSTPIADLATAGLVRAERRAASAALAADPRLGGLLVDTASGVELIERVVPSIDTAVLMAGGFGKRLRPLTDDTPKPLLDIGGRPLLCRILESLHAAGVRRVVISVHYLADRIRAAIRDGREFGLDVDYLEETRPLGTGAGLAMLGRIDRPFLVLNGDILTRADLTALARHHLLADHAVTVGTWLHAAPLPYGVVHHDGARVESIEEKPVYRYPINAGVYAFAPEVLELVEPGAPLAMVDFLNDHVDRLRIGRFPIVEYWNDIGSHADYDRAQAEVDTP